MTDYRVGVIGWPVAHSLSPIMHNAAFAALGLNNWHYEALAIPPDIIGHSIKAFRGEGGYTGLNVTVPHKQAVMRFVRPDEHAMALGAVNTIDFRDNRGTNTDVLGFMQDLAAHNIAVAGERVIVLGAGGAARAAVYGLVQAGAQVAVVNRTPERAQVMLADLTLSAGIRGVMVQSLADAVLDGVSLVVNCTTVGMHPEIDANPWSADVPFPEGVAVYDMVYRPAQTRLMQLATANGGQAIGGLGMLVRQGAAAFEIWTGQAAPVDVMFAAVQDALNQRS